MTTRDEIFAKVRYTLVEALSLDEDEVAPEATLGKDLGAESIDYMDIVFRLEREFGLKIWRNELFPEYIFQGDPDCVQNGKVTDVGLARLKKAMPHADFTWFELNPKVEDIADLITVGYVVGYIEWRLAPVL